MSPDFSLEQTYTGIVAGVDEVGRGPLAGPVVAAAVILEQGNVPAGINDSKKLSPLQREKLCHQLKQVSRWAIGVASVEEIDTYNILGATKLAMRRAVEALPCMPTIALIDGNAAPVLACEARTVIGGDTKSLSIAAASIIAKVTRDEMMQVLAKEYPFYGWEQNAGYGTKQHCGALEIHGVTPHHRKSFAPIKYLIHEQFKEAVEANAL